MVVPTTLSAARVLMVGVGDLVDEISRNLVSGGVSNVTIMHATTSTVAEGVHFMQKDPEVFIKTSKDYFTDFHLVLSANQPRPFELALSEIRWPKSENESDPDLPLMVMRNAGNNCKFRCQYRELPIQGSEASKFVSLPMDLLPWTDEKQALVASIVEDEFKPAQNPDFRAYLKAAHGMLAFHEAKGSWPGSGDKEEVFAHAQSFDGLVSEVRKNVEIMCEGGLSAAKQTTILLGRLVGLDALKLLTGSGRPVNNSNIDDVIRIAAKML